MMDVDIQRILSKFKNGNCTDEEIYILINASKSDENLKKLINLDEEIDGSDVVIKERKLRKLAEQFDDESQKSGKRQLLIDALPDKKSKKINQLRFGRIAAIALMLIGIIIAIDYFKRDSFSSKQKFDSIVEQSVEHYPNTLATRNGVSPGTRRSSIDFNNGMIAYDQRNYNTCITLLNNYIKQQPEDLEVRFYLGHASLHNKNISSAIEHLEYIRKANFQNSNSLLKTTTLYNLFLAELLNKNRRKALTIFNEIEESSKWKNTARKILKAYDDAYH